MPTQTDYVTATVARLFEWHCFAVDDWGREYFVSYKNVSRLGAGWDGVKAAFGDYVVTLRGIPIQQPSSPGAREKWELLEVEVIL